MAGGGGGAWKVAYADFVTAMMAFFLVMWIVAQNKPVKEAIAGYFRDPSGSGLTPGGQGFLEGGAPRSKQGATQRSAAAAVACRRWPCCKTKKERASGRRSRSRKLRPDRRPKSRAA